jgi:hypothetical protein
LEKITHMVNESSLTRNSGRELPSNKTLMVLVSQHQPQHTALTCSGRLHWNGMAVSVRGGHHRLHYIQEILRLIFLVNLNCYCWRSAVHSRDCNLPFCPSSNPWNKPGLVWHRPDCRWLSSVYTCSIRDDLFQVGLSSTL